MSLVRHLALRRRFSTAVALAAFFALMIGQDALATFEITSGRVGDIPTFAGTGLQGYYYDNGAGQFSNFDQLIHDSIGPLTGNTASATFLTQNICYPNCAGSSIGDGQGGLAFFLNGNATAPGFTGTPRNTFNNSGLIIDGYIAIATPGSYSFQLQSDDNSVLRLGNFVADRFNTIDLSFSTAGLYQIAVNFTEDGGGSRLSLTASNDDGGTCLLGCSDGNGGYTNAGIFYSQGQLDSAPAPTIGGGPAGGMALAVLGGAALYRRRRQA